MKINIGDLFVREGQILVFYISGIHESGQYKLQYISNNPNIQYRHQYHYEETLIEWVKNGSYQHFPVKE